MIRKILCIALLASFLGACSDNDDDDSSTLPVTTLKQTYPLPGDTLFPEGIAYHQPSATFFTGSVYNGNILRVNEQTGEVTTFATGAAHNRAAATGMKIDKNNRLWVCGGSSNTIQVLSLDGTLLKSWDTKALLGSGFINDCTIDDTHVYFTDSQVQKIYRTDVTAAQPGNLEEWLSFTNNEIPYTTGTNANGIVSTPDGLYLIVVITISGKLYRIEKATKAITEINLSAPVTAGDGLYLIGQKLYVSRNALGQIFPVTLDANYLQGTLGDGFGTNLLFNTTIDRSGNDFLVVNGQLNRRGNATTPQNPVLPFTVSRVAIPQ